MDVYCDITVMRNDITVMRNDITVMRNDITVMRNDINVDVGCTDAYTVAGLLLDPLESEVLEMTYLVCDLSKRGREGGTHMPFMPMPGSTFDCISSS